MTELIREHDMKSFKVEEEFAGMTDFILALPENINVVGKVIQDYRNVVKQVTLPQGTFVVKNFKGMYFFNRLAYSLFRKSKAARSHQYSKILNERGILTPTPVAWMNCYSFGLLTESYFVSVYSPRHTLQAILTDQAKPVDGSEKLMLYKHLAAFAFRLHALGIYHDDFSSGNILVKPTDDGYEFSMVDLNRIKFKEVSYQAGLQNFAKLPLSPEDTNLLIREYAILSRQSPEKSIELYWSYKKRSSYFRHLRKSLRSYTLTPLEKLFGQRCLGTLIVLSNLVVDMG